jgi:hypothetical protein
MSVSATSPARPASPARSSSPHRAGATKPTDQDVRAMKDAFTLARKGGQPQGRALVEPGKGKEDMRGFTGGDAQDKGEAAVDGLDERQTVLRDDRDQDQGGAQGWAFGQALADAPVIVPNAPSPQVDAGAFAQLMSQLWAQARQKNEREVRVKFGTNAWPATGARLVRNAAGTLDIALEMERGQPADLGSLSDALEQAGVALGHVGVAESA